MRNLGRRSFLVTVSCSALLSNCDNRTIKVLLYKIPLEIDAIENRLSEFNTAKSISVVQPIAGDLKEIEDTVKNGASGIDVIYIDDVWLSGVSRKGFLAPLGEQINRDMPEFLTDYSEATRTDMAASYGVDGANAIFMIPQRTDVQVLFFNKAIFNDRLIRDRYRIRTGIELAVPETWDQYIEVARGLHGLRYRHGTVTGTIETLKPPHYSFEFYACRYWAYASARQGREVGLFENDAKPEKAIFGDDGLGALQLILDVLPASDPLSLNAEHFEPNGDHAPGSINIFEKGLTALMPQWYSFYSDLATSGIGADLGIAQIPGIEDKKSGALYRTPCLGGGGIAIPARSGKKEMAWEFIRYFTGRKFSAEAASLGLITPRLSAYQERHGSDLTQSQSIYFQSLKIARPRPRHENYVRLEQIIGNAIHDALDSSQSTFQRQKGIRDAAIACDDVLGR